MTVNIQKNSFNAGELSPQMLGRSDLPYYKDGVQTLENFLIRPQGGIVKRSGTRFLLEVKDSGAKGRVVPFVFSTTQAYILEFGALRLRFFKDESWILAPTQTFVDGDVSVANDEINIASHRYVDEQGPFQFTTTVQLPAGIALATDYYIVNTGLTGTPATDYIGLSLTPGGAKVDIISAAAGGTHSITPEATTVHELVTTYTEAELPDLRFAQSADVLYIVHPDHAPAKLTRTGHTTWTLTDLDLIDGPYLGLREPEVGDDILASSITLDPDADTGTVNLVASGVGFFDATRDVGRMLRYGAATNWGGMVIASVASATVATADVVSGWDPTLEPPEMVDVADPGASVFWYMGAYYPNNYPRTVGFFEGRLVLAGTPLEPERFDASVSGGWNDFAITERGAGQVVDDSSLSYQLGGANDVQIIRWVATLRNLIVGTTGGIWPVQASSQNEAVTPTNVNLPRSSAFGCSAVNPVTPFSTVIYVSRTGKKILGAGYGSDVDAYDTSDLTIMSEHITGAGIDFLEYQQEPHSVVWALRSDGQLAGMTYERGQKVHGWHRHVIGGAFSGGDAVVESVAVIPSPNEDHDQIWMIVKRTVNSATVRYIEFLEQDFSDSDDIEDAFFLDSGLTYDSTPTSTITGLEHLEGETVQVLADGAAHADRTVASGSITLAAPASVVHVGYSYNADCEMLPMEWQDQKGSTAGRTRRPTHAWMRLHRTLGLQHGPDSSNLTSISHSALFTGMQEATLTHAHGVEPVLYLRQPDPLPATILAVVGKVGVGKR